MTAAEDSLHASAPPPRHRPESAETERSNIRLLFIRTLACQAATGAKTFIVIYALAAPELAALRFAMNLGVLTNFLALGAPYVLQVTYPAVLGSGDKTRLLAIEASTLFLSWGAGIVCLVMTTICMTYGWAMPTYGIVLGIGALLTSLYFQQSNLNAARGDFRRFATAEVGLAFSALACSAVGLWRHPMAAACVAMALGPAVALALGGGVARPVLKPPAGLGQTAKIGVRLTAAQLGLRVLTLTDFMMMSFLGVDREQLGYYAFAYTVSFQLPVLLNPLTLVYVRRALLAIDDGTSPKRLREQMGRLHRLMLVLGSALVVAGIAAAVVGVPLFLPRYQKALPLVPGLLVGQCISTVLQADIALLQSMNKHAVIIMAAIAGAVFPAVAAIGVTMHLWSTLVVSLATAVGTVVFGIWVYGSSRAELIRRCRTSEEA